MRSLAFAAAILLVATTAVAECPQGEVAVRQVHLTNINFATVDEQRQIAASVVGRCLGPKRSQAAERIRAAFQDHGFFRAQVSEADVAFESGVLTAVVEEGARYRLQSITFRGNNALTNSAALRHLFKIRDGDIFDRQAVLSGLGDLRSTYGEYGYLNFTAIPQTDIDESVHSIALTIDINEGKQFYIKAFHVLGAEPSRTAAIQAAWLEMLRPGKIYNSRLVQYFFDHNRPLLGAATPEKNLSMSTDEQFATVDITLDLRQP